MMLFRTLVLLTLAISPMFIVSGCGPKVSGVADAPETPPPELTPEEENTEKAYHKNQ